MLISERRDNELFLDQLHIKVQFTKKKKTLKTLVLSRAVNTLPNWKSSYEEQAGSDKNLSANPIPWSAAALNEIYKANQSTDSPLKLEIVLKLAHLLCPLEQTTNRCTLDDLISDHEL